MVDDVILLHSVARAVQEKVLQEGLQATSSFDDLGLEMRRNVVYCWLEKDHDRMSSGGQRVDHVYVEVTVDRRRCRVAEMDFASLAIMYAHGAGGRPQNPEASRLLAELYQTTSVPLAEYRAGVFSSPEVLVKGRICASSIRLR